MEDRLALSALDWWEEAGVDMFVDDAPRDWLAQPTPAPEPAPSSSTHVAPGGSVRAPLAASAAPIAAAAPPPAALPDDLAAFRRFLLEDASVPGPAAARLDATGDPASGAMLILDMPEQGDRAAARLLSGDVGQLFDRMLGAMTLSREIAYLAPLSPARSASGRLTPETIASLATLMRHHIALVRPKRLLLLGDAPTRALLGFGCVEARGRTHEIAGPTGAIPAVASFHPRLLIQTPDRKKAAWADLQLFMAL
ncbi:uracil-DNA glycosylase [Sphingomonas sp. AP4-R1]|uniref:uracil-DNA glycosylase family protein n=1 Tax=Sphingomonas sp. AP4-R1 TaxID=2735134 RepID=UPI001493D924|nr:uracil-DNA glycosylase family protein [Sphingomonas sp. AP4-R1]QJU59728.1 uracil-DNA glycosylase [Sphingomonas sp. AP4-R1]